MKKSESGKFTIYEENDICSLDEYSETLAEELEKEFDTTKNDRTNIKKSIENIQNEQETQNTNIENLEKDNKTNKEDISNLKKQDISQNELIEQLQKRNALLESQIPIGTVEGENITIKGSSNMPFKEISIGGNDYQKTSEASSNVLDLKKLEVYKLSTNTTYDISNSNSIKVTAGTGNSYQNVAFKLDLEDGDYIGYLGSAEPSNTEMTIKRMTISEYVDNVRTALKHIDVGNNNNNNTFTITNAENKVYVLEFWGNYSTNIENTTTYNECYIAKGTSFSAYEEFVPDMPSTKYESPVRACGDNINILITENSSNYTINSDGTYNEDINRLCSDFIKVNSNKQDYILSANQSLGFVGIAFYDKDKNYVGRGVENGVKTLAITKPQGIVYLRVFFQGNLLSSQSWFDYGIKLEKGSTATTYSKPNQGNITLNKSNKNILNLLEKSITINSTKVQNKTSNSIDMIAINTWSNFYTSFRGLNKNTDYSISADFIETVMESNTVAISIYSNVNGTLTLINSLSRKITKNNSEKIQVTFNTGDNELITIRFWNNFSATAITEGNSLVKVTEIQLEEGKPTDFIEPKSEEYIVPTQAPFYEGDTFVKQDGKWYEKHNKYIKIFNGTENISLTSSGNSFRIYVTDILKNTNTNEKADISSNMYKVDSWNNRNTNNSEGTFAQYSDSIGFDKGDFETVDEFKAHLTELFNKGTPLYIVYPLAEPIFIPCTDDQNAELDEIEKDENYKNITHIYSEDEISPLFDIEYYKDLNTMFNNINTALLGGN